MRVLRTIRFAVLLLAAGALAAARPALAQTAPRQETVMPSDIDPRSGFRLPLPKREDLDEAARKTYDDAARPGASIAGLHGPAGVQLYSPKTTAHLRALNRYLRFEAGFSPRIREIAILATAREMDSQFEWVAHEPEALKEGVPPEVVDVIKHRRSTAGLMDERDVQDDRMIRAILDAHVCSGDGSAAAKAAKEPAVCSYHKLRLRHSGRYHWVDFHLVVPATWNVEQGHRVASAARIRACAPRPAFPRPACRCSRSRCLSWSAAHGRAASRNQP